MHLQIIRDRPGQCPICGMDLVPMQSVSAQPGIDSSLLVLVKPVDQYVVSDIATIIPETGIRIFSEEVQGIITYDSRNQTNISSRVSGRIERLLIKYNYQPVSKGQLIMEIYSPDLVAAQRELLFTYRNDRNDPMLQRAKQRLSLLGMTPGQVAHVIRTGQPLYRVGVFSNAGGYILEKSATQIQNQPLQSQSLNANSMDEMSGGTSNSAMSPSSTLNVPLNSPVLIREGQYVSAGESLFMVYKAGSFVAEFSFPPQLAAEIKPGLKLVYRLSSDSQHVFTGIIGLIEPVFRNGQNFTVARVYIPQRTSFSAGSLLTANIPIVKRSGWWIPRESLYQLGTRSIVFRKENNAFIPKEVKVGYSMKGTLQVLTNISGWEIARNASYLVDSESFIKTTATEDQN